MEACRFAVADDLATAQHEIASNWIAAYKKYFHTQTPLVPRPRALNRKQTPAEPDLCVDLKAPPGAWAGTRSQTSRGAST